MRGLFFASLWAIKFVIEVCAWLVKIVAATNGHAEIVEALLEKGADPNLQNADGDTAFRAILDNIRCYGCLYQKKLSELCINTGNVQRVATAMPSSWVNYSQQEPTS